MVFKYQNFNSDLISFLCKISFKIKNFNSILISTELKFQFKFCKLNKSLQKLKNNPTSSFRSQSKIPFKSMFMKNIGMFNLFCYFRCFSNIQFDDCFVLKWTVAISMPKVLSQYNWTITPHMLVSLAPVAIGTLWTTSTE